MTSSLKPMHRIFDDEKLEELKELYQQRDEDGKPRYTKTQLADKYGCSVTTICLWLNPDDRVREEKFRSRTTQTRCDCGKDYETHAKCAICKVNTHSLPELAWLASYFKFGAQTKNPVLCDMCYEKHAGKTIVLTGYFLDGATFTEYSIRINPYTKEIV